MKIFITGSTKGIGKALAEKMIEQGHEVLVSSERSLSQEEINKLFNIKNNINYIKCDISRKMDILNAKKYIEENWGKLDYFVANAGIIALPSGTFEISDENIEKNIHVNFIGTFNSLKIFGQLIEKNSNGGSMVALTSVDGIIGEPFAPIYSGTKAAIISMTKSFAREFAGSVEDGKSKNLVRVNAVAPGLIDTPLTKMTGEIVNETTDISIIKRIGDPEEIADGIEFLLSNKASYITGQVLVIDGGFTLK